MIFFLSLSPSLFCCRKHQGTRSRDILQQKHFHSPREALEGFLHPIVLTSTVPIPILYSIATVAKFKKNASLLNILVRPSTQSPLNQSLSFPLLRPLLYQNSDILCSLPSLSIPNDFLAEFRPMRNQLIDFGNGTKRGFRILMETPIDFESFGNFTHFVDPSSESKEKKSLLLFEYVPVVFGEGHRKGGRER